MSEKETSEQENKRRKLVSGVVLSNKMDKTIVVEVTSLKKHPKYGKYFKVFKKLKAHDEANACEIGDRVEIIESQPISKEKRFRLYRVVQKVERVDVEVQDDLAGVGA